MLKIILILLALLAFDYLVPIPSVAAQSIQIAVKEITSNSSKVALLAGASYVGASEGSLDGNAISVTVKTDQAGSLFIDQSMDSTNWDAVNTYIVAANVNTTHRVGTNAKYFRVRFTNTSLVAQTYFRIQTLLGNQGLIGVPLNKAMEQSADSLLVRAFSEERMIASGLISGYSIVNRFAYNGDVDSGAAEDIWEVGGDYAGFPAVSEPVAVLSSSVLDTAIGTGCRTVQIFGLDSNYDAKNETLSLSGVTPVVSVNTYSRIFRGQCVTAGSLLSNQGNITIRHATTATNVFGQITAGKGQTQSSSYTIPLGHTGFLTSYTAQLIASTANQNTNLAIKIIPFGGATRQAREFAVTSNYAMKSEVYGGIRFTEKTDFVFRAFQTSSNNQSIAVTWDMIVVKN